MNYLAALLLFSCAFKIHLEKALMSLKYSEFDGSVCGSSQLDQSRAADLEMCVH